MAATSDRATLNGGSNEARQRHIVQSSFASTRPIVGKLDKDVVVGDTDVTSHYGSPNLGRELVSALERAFGDSVDAAALWGVDQFHLGGYLATEAMLNVLDLDPEAEVLDVGCGIGGVTGRSTRGSRVLSRPSTSRLRTSKQPGC